MRVVHGSQAPLVQEFGGRYLCSLHGHHGLGGRYHVREINHGAGLVRGDGQGFHGHFGEEGQGSLGAHHQMGEHLEGVFVCHKGPQIKAGHVFDAVFIADAFCHFFVGHDLFPELFQSFNNLRMHLQEGLPGTFRARVQDGTVGQYYAGAQEHLVRVGVGAAAHAGSVVGHYSAHHATAYRGRIRAEVPAEGCQVLVHPGPHDAGLQRHGGVVVVFPFLPVFAGYHQDAVRDGLPRKGGSGCAESHRQAHSMRQGQNPGDFVLIGRPQDHLGP